MKQIPHKTSCKRILQIEKEIGVNIEEFLRQKYIDENLTIREIANLLNIAYATAYKWLVWSGIYSKKLIL